MSALDILEPNKLHYSPDDISGGLVLHGGVDKGDERNVGHIADVSVDQELEVCNVDQRQIAAMIILFR